MRVLLAACLAFCSEVVLWSGGLTREPRSALETPLLIVGYLALAALLLDLLTRYRVRDLFGVLTLAGIYGLLGGVLLNPAMALADVPRTLLTRVMGAHALMGLLAWAIFLGLTYGLSGRLRRNLVLIAVALLAVGWGGWARWASPASVPLCPPICGIQDFAVSTPPLALDAIIAAAVGLIIIGAAWTFTRRGAASQNQSLALPPLPRLITIAALIGIGAIRLAQAQIDSLSLVVVIALVIFCISILWFQLNVKRATFADVLMLGTEETPLYWILLAVVFVVIGAVAHQLPRGTDAGDAVAVWGLIFTGFGLVWLPTVALVIGGRAMWKSARGLRL